MSSGDPGKKEPEIRPQADRPPTLWRQRVQGETGAKEDNHLVGEAGHLGNRAPPVPRKRYGRCGNSTTSSFPETPRRSGAGGCNLPEVNPSISSFVGSDSPSIQPVVAHSTSMLFLTVV